MEQTDCDLMCSVNCARVAVVCVFVLCLRKKACVHSFTCYTHIYIVPVCCPIRIKVRKCDIKLNMVCFKCKLKGSSWCAHMNKLLFSVCTCQLHHNMSIQQQESLCSLQYGGKKYVHLCIFRQNQLVNQHVCINSVLCILYNQHNYC